MVIFPGILNVFRFCQGLLGSLVWESAPGVKAWVGEAVEVVRVPILELYNGISVKTTFSKLPSSTNPKIVGFTENAPQEIFQNVMICI